MRIGELSASLGLAQISAACRAMSDMLMAPTEEEGTSPLSMWHRQDALAGASSSLDPNFHSYSCCKASENWHSLAIDPQHSKEGLQRRLHAYALNRMSAFTKLIEGIQPGKTENV
jgi:hypothetical protein